MSTSYRHGIVVLATALAGALAFVACTDGPFAPRPSQLAPTSRSSAIHSFSSAALWEDTTAWARTAWVCTTDSPGSFSITVAGAPSTSIEIARDSCVPIHYNESDSTELVAVRWLDSLSGPLDSLVSDSTDTSATTRYPTLTDTLTKTVGTTASTGGILVFYGAAAFFSRDVPDGMPDSLTSPTRILTDADSIGVPVYREIVLVKFKASTTPYQRALAAATVGGSLIGGQQRTGSEGYYVLHVPDDSTGAAAESAVSTLETMPTVDVALHLYHHSDATTYWRPSDGAGMSSTDWSLDPDSSFDVSSYAWGPSAVGAPFAWGCASGQGVRVAVIDLGMAANGEFAGRIASGSRLHPPLAGDVNAHGQRVASVLGAAANNGRGIAGIAHESELMLLDAAVYVGSSPRLDAAGNLGTNANYIGGALYEAGFAGARVVSISLGVSQSGSPNANQVKQWAREAKSWKSELTSGVSAGNAQLPLLVISAGNNSATGVAQWGSVAGLATLLPSTTILVSGAAPSLGVPGVASTGSGNIDLWAPGDSVATFDSIGGLTRHSGSSYATPMVAGTAALMLELDPSLTAVELRTLLISSGSSARGINGKPFLDAYEALKSVAQRSGTPLCGNRVWADTANNVYAQRTATVALFNAGSDPGGAAMINVRRGGRQIDLFNYGLRYDFVMGSWQAGTFSDTDTAGWSGAFKGSVLMQDKEDQFATSVEATWNDAGISFKVLRYALPSWLPIDSVMTSTVSLSLGGSMSFMCSYEVRPDSTAPYSCWGGELVGTRQYLIPNPNTWDPVFASAPAVEVNSSWGHALDPQGRFVVVPVVARELNVQYDTLWGPCAGGLPYPNHRCRDRTAKEIATAESKLVRIDLSNGAVHELTTVALAVGEEPLFLSINEKGEEFAMQVASVTIDLPTGAVSGCANGRYDWLALPLGGTSMSLAHRVSMSGKSVCEMVLWGGVSSSLREKP